ncbi:MAG: Holliday junction resolvase RuvX [Bacilli bacterium]|nr:Holliday junction resolvase RuvX [Bacilli bacterium]
MKYLGLDLGTKTLGIAISETGLIASFYDSFRYDNEDELISKIEEIVKKEKIDVVVLGLPINMDGSLGFRAEETISFKDKLEGVLDKEVALQDERLSTKVATDVLIEADMSRKKRKGVIDGVSAVVILQTYLDRKDRNYD